MTDQDKPRICEVLGGEDTPLEIGEEISYKNDDGVEFVMSVLQNGRVRFSRMPTDGNFCLTMLHALQDAINHHDRIIRKPRFTPEEMVCIKVLYAAGVKFVVRDWDSDLHWYDSDIQWSGTEFTVVGDWHGTFGRLPDKSFSSIRPGQSVKLEEICGA